MRELELRRGKLRKVARDPRWWTLNYGKTSVRLVEPMRGETFDQALTRCLDAMPRKPFKFLAMVAEAEKRRAQQELVDKRKAAARRRYLKRMKR